MLFSNIMAAVSYCLEVAAQGQTRKICADDWDGVGRFDELSNSKFVAGEDV